MKRSIKKKFYHDLKNTPQVKEIFKYYRGIRLLQYSPYTKGHEVMALLPDIEGYFKSFSHAKRYIDRHFFAIQEESNKPWPE